ncbi:hypothetical protein C1H76_3010 [Elsinoe australis]|uniref:Phosphoglycerate mutase-like protein n=1 Tax=Elsinoe australis TaxID=40998 RepID=A0A4U7B544_9PEZI|nr:hypothetical protein C1H76_3010 [Elsinoe australis]
MVAFALSLLSGLALHSSVVSAKLPGGIGPASTGHKGVSTPCETSKTKLPISTTAAASPLPSGHHENSTTYFNYSTLNGIFLQDLNSTNQTGFDYTAQNFGLLNTTYPIPPPPIRNPTQWQLLNHYLTHLNRASPRAVSYKLLFLARHGQGVHNGAETFYTTPNWNCYYAQADGNSTATWFDAALLPSGTTQAFRARNYWARLLAEESITPPSSFYVSPLTRCLQTAEDEWRNLTLPRGYEFRPLVKERLREGISIHSCDRRHPRRDIAAAFPRVRFEKGFSEEDPLWSGVEAETSKAQDERSAALLDDVFGSDEAQVISFTSHSGEIASLLRVVGHRVWGLATGEVLPVVVRAERGRGAREVGSASWTSSQWCTNGAPVTSISGGACVCQNGVSPTAVSPGLVFSTRPVM